MGDTGHECEKCTFVATKEDIFVDPKIVRDFKKEPVLLGLFTLPGWRGHLAFYLFKCCECGYLSVDYPGGYTDFGLLFFKCGGCEAIFPLKGRWSKKIYQGYKMPAPSMSRRKREKELQKVVPKNGPKALVMGRKRSWLEKLLAFFGF